MLYCMLLFIFKINKRFTIRMMLHFYSFIVNAATIYHDLQGPDALYGVVCVSAIQCKENLWNLRFRYAKIVNSAS